MPTQPSFALEVVNPKEIGHGNAAFLADLAEGVGLAELRARWKAGKYPGSDLEFIRANLKFWNLTKGEA